MIAAERLNTVIVKAQSGDTNAFGELYDAYSAALFGVSLKILGEPEAAEDSVQETFVKIWKNIRKFDVSKGTFFTWALNINRNTAIDQYRKRAKKSAISIQNDDSYVNLSKGDSEVRKTNHIGIAELLDGLPEKQQIILEYIYFKGFTQQETADELDIPLGTVKTRSRDALKSLKRLFVLLTAWI